MAQQHEDAVHEARALLAECRARIGGNNQTTLGLLTRAVERLADAIEAGAASPSAIPAPEQEAPDDAHGPPS